MTSFSDQDGGGLFFARFSGGGVFLTDCIFSEMSLQNWIVMIQFYFL